MKYAVGAAVIAAALAYALGYSVGGAQADQRHAQKFMEAAAASQQAANTQATSSANTSAAVDAQQAASALSINTISEEVSKRLEQQEPKIIYRTKVVNQCADDDVPSTRPQPDQFDDVAAPWRFDTGTVRLLNAARLGLSAESTSVSDGQGDDTPSTVGVGEFAENDLQVVERYHALKIKHDALVGWVDQLKEQNLGLCVASEPLYESSMEDP